MEPEAYLPVQQLPDTPPDPASPAVTAGPAQTLDISAYTPYPTGSPYALPTSGIPTNQIPPRGWPGSTGNAGIPSTPILTPPDVPNVIQNPPGP
jgi:hypothetical protein